MPSCQTTFKKVQQTFYYVEVVAFLGHKHIFNGLNKVRKFFCKKCDFLFCVGKKSRLSIIDARCIFDLSLKGKKKAGTKEVVNNLNVNNTGL